MGLGEGYVAYVHKFRNSALTVVGPRRTYSRAGHEIYDEGYTARFYGHLFTTDDPKIIDAMDNHVKYGVTFQRVKSGADYDLIRRHGRNPVQMMRGPATTMAERLGAPKTLPPDATKIEAIAPPPKPAPVTKPATKKGGGK